MPKIYRANLTGVFGDPVDANPTVVLQEAGFNALGLNWRYLTIKVTAKNLADAFKGFKAMNFSGINLTMPHKIEALKYMDSIAQSARLIGAINTVTVDADGKLTGHNTDGQGMIESMREAGIPLAKKRLVILGAGGAARAIAVECALAGVKEMTIVNRSRAKGDELAALINNNTECSAAYIPWKGTAQIPECDILVNATNIGMYPNTDKPDIDYSAIKPGTAVIDVVFEPAITPFLSEAEKHGAKIYDGLGMLVNQGAIAFGLWTGLKAPKAEMAKALKAALSDV